MKKDILAQDSKLLCVMDREDNRFAKRFWTGLAMAFGAAAAIAISLLLMGMVTYYSRIYDWP